MDRPENTVKWIAVLIGLSLIILNGIYLVWRGSINERFIETYVTESRTRDARWEHAITKIMEGDKKVIEAVKAIDQVK